jgi:hypothetical protein
MSHASLDELYARVTEAIRQSESLSAEGRARDAMIAYHEVSRIEEQIARILPADDPEGALARQGVVTAALDAGDITRAIERARFYARAGGLSPAFRAEIDALRREAEEALRELQGGDEPMVVPVPFTLVLDAA